MSLPAWIMSFAVLCWLCCMIDIYNRMNGIAGIPWLE